MKTRLICDIRVPFILLTPESVPIATLRTKLADAFDITQKPHYGSVGTFTGFNPDIVPLGRIDYVFVDGTEVASITHIDDRRADQYFVSDHLPVLVELKLKGE